MAATAIEAIVVVAAAAMASGTSCKRLALPSQVTSLAARELLAQGSAHFLPTSPPLAGAGRRADWRARHQPAIIASCERVDE